MLSTNCYILFFATFSLLQAWPLEDLENQMDSQSVHFEMKHKVLWKKCFIRGYRKVFFRWERHCTEPNMAGGDDESLAQTKFFYFIDTSKDKNPNYTFYHYKSVHEEPDGNAYFDITEPQCSSLCCVYVKYTSLERMKNYSDLTGSLRLEALEDQEDQEMSVLSIEEYNQADDSVWLPYNGSFPFQENETSRIHLYFRKKCIRLKYNNSSDHVGPTAVVNVVLYVMISISVFSFVSTVCWNMCYVFTGVRKNSEKKKQFRNWIRRKNTKYAIRRSLLEAAKEQKLSSLAMQGITASNINSVASIKTKASRTDNIRSRVKSLIDMIVIDSIVRASSMFSTDAPHSTAVDPLTIHEGSNRLRITGISSGVDPIEPSATSTSRLALVDDLPISV